MYQLSAATYQLRAATYQLSATTYQPPHLHLWRAQ